MQIQLSCKKGAAFKSLGEKVVGQEMAAMMLKPMSCNNVRVHF